jgi:hypothetical protein
MAKHLSKKIISILFLISIISGCLQYILLTEYTLKNEYIPRKMTAEEYDNYFYLNSHPKFNYFNGIWLIFGGLIFISTLCLLELPLKTEILKQEIKRDFYKKKFLNNTFDITTTHER